MNIHNEESKNLNTVIGKISGKHITSIDRHNGATYVHHKYIDRRAEETKEDTVDGYINFIRSIVINHYMKSVNVYQVDDDFFRDDHLNSDPYVDKMLDSKLDELLKDKIIEFSRISRREGISRFKIASDNIDMYLSVSRVAKFGVVESKWEIHLFVTEFHHKDNLCMVTHVMIDTNRHLHCNDMAIGPVIISKKEKVCEQFVKNNKINITGPMTVGKAFIIITAIDKLLDNRCEKISDLPPTQHSRCEKSIYQYILKRMWDTPYYFVNIVSWVKVSDHRFSKLKSSTDAFKILIGEDIKCPKVDFNEKEWKFIDKYVHQKGIVPRINEGNPTPVNFADVLSHPKYGKTLEFMYNDKSSGEKYPIKFTYEYDAKLDICRFYIIYLGIDEFTPFITVDYTNISAMLLIDGLAEIDTNISLTKFDDIPSSNEDIMNVIPKPFKTNDGIMIILWHILGTLLVIHDRPNRHKMVRIEQSSSSKSKGSSNSSNSKSKSERNKDDVLISRILMPSKEAKEYVRIMTSSSSGESGESHRNYVIESWERAGHYRRLPNSDKQIWIEETTCRRHKPLSDKEVHIKL